MSATPDFLKAIVSRLQFKSPAIGKIVQLAFAFILLAFQYVQPNFEYRIAADVYIGFTILTAAYEQLNLFFRKDGEICCLECKRPALKLEQASYHCQACGKTCDLKA